MNTRIPSLCRSRASALLVVLWVVALLSFLITTSMMVAMQQVEAVAARKLASRARLLAEMGLAAGAHPLVKENDPVLRHQLSSMEGYEVRLSTEEARLNLNLLLTEERRPVLESMLGQWGLNPAEAQALADSLMDWTDADDLSRLQGAEILDYAGAGSSIRPANRPFRSLQEARKVRGMSRLDEVHPAWMEAFTLWGDGRLDINEAAPELIALVVGCPVHLAEALRAQKRGPDGQDHTEDDQLIENLEEALAFLGLEGEAADGAASLFTTRGSTLRVESVGRSGDHARGLSVVMARQAGNPRILEWREFVPE